MEHMENADALVRWLQSRYNQNKPYTMCSQVCISINPLVWLPIYDESTKKQYSNPGPGIKKMGAHIYRVAETSHGCVKDGSQTIVIAGESGAGKTEVARICLEYIASKEEHGTLLTRVLETHPILEYMGNAQTIRNGNSSRFGKFLSLFYENGIQRCAGIKTYLLEKGRAVHTTPREGNFRIFYAIIADEAIRNEYALQTIPFAILGEATAAVDTTFACFKKAAHVVGLTHDDLTLITRTIVTILWLNVRDLPSAAMCMGLDPTDLNRVLTNRRIRVSNEEEYWTECSSDDTKMRMKALAMDLYHRLFCNLIKRMNTEIGAREKLKTTGQNALHILDIFGFEIFETNGFEQLCINYCNERMQQLFVEDVIVMQQLEYANEGVNWTSIEFDSNARIVEMFDNVLFSDLDEAHRLKSTPASFVEMVNVKRPFAFSIPLVRNDVHVFCINHFAGNVQYTAENFLERNADDLRPEIVELVREANFVNTLYCKLNAIRNTLWTNTVSNVFRRNMKELSSTILQGRAHYIRCIKPNDTSTIDFFDTSMVRQQIVSGGLIQAYQVMRNGYEHRLRQYVFLLRFPWVSGKRSRRCAAIASGGLWGKTIVYMTRECYQRVNQLEAQFKIKYAMKKYMQQQFAARRIQHSIRVYVRVIANRRNRLAIRLQRAFRTHRRHVANARLKNAAQHIQRMTRGFINRESRRYREQDEITKLKEQNALLRAAVKQRDEWIFRATRILKAKSSSDSRISNVLLARPSKLVEETNLT